ncbi:Gp15 family bacteriophage protein [Eremococcus coleocola]|uniref:Gp15 family bacteriophage protein n=1 Tax=Eremococcus coleocola TaxID=88132 RepID=UPI0004184B47|nr:Gp15 family bacteriophage protein [Eremococcus coleocola]
MLDLSRPLDDKLILDDQIYPLNLSFDIVLKVFELLRDKSIPDVIKPFMIINMFTGVDFANKLTLEEAIEIYQAILDEHILDNASEDVVRDISGNIIPLPKKESDDKQEKRNYSLRYDSDYIYASFLQAYNIDLFEAQGKLHWKKFNALITGLPKDTKLSEVIQIRSWKPSKGESSEYKRYMRELQREYELPPEE